jgi:predicted kinase
MLKVIMTVGIPASSKTTWAKAEQRANPGTKLISRDDLRVLLDNNVYSPDNEKLIIEARNFLLTSALKRGHDVILHDTNLNKRNFEDVCSLVKSMNIDCMVMEKSFFVELDEAISRDAARSGHSHVGEEVIKKFWKQSGGNQHKFYKARVEVITAATEASEEATIAETNSLPWAIMCDLDGTISLFNTFHKDGTKDVRHAKVHFRSPYDASKCDEDGLNEPVAAVVEAMNTAGYKIIFCSGREDKYRSQTETFLKKHLTVPYELHMRKSGDQRKDSIIKGEIFTNKIKPNYNVSFVLDDRDQVCAQWRSMGLVCFQVAPGNF